MSERPTQNELHALKMFAEGKKPAFSTGICESLTCGYGKIDDNGYWEFPLYPAEKYLPSNASHVQEVEEQNIKELRDLFYKEGWGQNELLWKVCLLGYNFASKLRAKDTDDNKALLNTIANMQGHTRTLNGSLEQCGRTITALELTIAQLKEEIDFKKATMRAKDEYADSLRHQLETLQSELSTSQDHVKMLREALLIAQDFVNSFTAEECSDAIAIPINEALAATAPKGETE